MTAALATNPTVTRVPVSNVILRRVEGGDFYDIAPVICGSLAEACRSLSRMAANHPPKAGLLGDAVEVEVIWEGRLHWQFTYRLKAWAGRGCRMDGALEGSLLWAQEHGDPRASYLLQYCDLDQPIEELLAA